MCDYKMEKKDETSSSATIFCRIGLSFKKQRIMEDINNTVVPGNFSNSALTRPVGLEGGSAYQEGFRSHLKKHLKTESSQHTGYQGLRTEDVNSVDFWNIYSAEGKRTN